MPLKSQLGVKHNAKNLMLHEFRKVMLTIKIRVRRKYIPRPTNYHTLSFVRVQPHAPQMTPYADLTYFVNP